MHFSFSFSLYCENLRQTAEQNPSTFLGMNSQESCDVKARGLTSKRISYQSNQGNKSHYLDFHSPPDYSSETPILVRIELSPRQQAKEAASIHQSAAPRQQFPPTW